jgi:hypothetical protein
MHILHRRVFDGAGERKPAALISASFVLPRKDQTLRRAQIILRDVHVIW